MAASRWIFPLRKLLFFDLTGYLFEIAYFAHLIESCPTVHGLSSCVEKKNIDPSCSPYYSDHVRLPHSYFLHFRMLLFFSVTSYPAEIAHFNSPNRELSNFVRLMELYWSKIVDRSRSPCLKIVDGKCHFYSFDGFYFPVLSCQNCIF